MTVAIEEVRVKTELENLTATRVRLSISLDASDLNPAFEKAFKAISSQMNIPGFRKGKVPRAVIEQRVGREAVLSEAINEAVPHAYEQAVREHSLVPLSQPELDVAENPTESAVSFTAEVDIRPEFELPAYSSLQVSVDEALVPESQVEDQLDGLRSRFASLRAVERPAADGDVLLVNLKGSHDGAEVSDLSGNALSYELGTDGMLPGFDEAVRGAAADDERTFTFTPEGGEWAGKELTVTVTVSAVRERDLPPADDSFAQLASEFDTIDELREDLRTRLGRVRVVEQAYQARDKVLEALVEAVDIPVPQNLVDAQVGDHFADGHGDGDLDHRAEVQRNVRRSLVAQMILDKVGEVEQVQVSDAEFTQWLISEAPRYQLSPQDFADQLVKSGALPSAFGEVRRAKALSFVLERATVTDSKGQNVDIAAAMRPAEPEFAGSEAGQ